MPWLARGSRPDLVCRSTEQLYIRPYAPKPVRARRSGPGSVPAASQAAASRSQRGRRPRRRGGRPAAPADHVHRDDHPGRRTLPVLPVLVAQERHRPGPLGAVVEQPGPALDRAPTTTWSSRRRSGRRPGRPPGWPGCRRAGPAGLCSSACGRRPREDVVVQGEAAGHEPGPAVDGQGGQPGDGPGGRPLPPRGAVAIRGPAVSPRRRCRGRRGRGRRRTPACPSGRCGRPGRR